MSKQVKRLKLVVKQGAIYAIYDDALTALMRERKESQDRTSIAR